MHHGGNVAKESKTSSSSANQKTTQASSLTWQQRMLGLTERLKEQVSFLWLTQWGHTTDRSPKQPPSSHNFQKDIPSSPSLKESSTEQRISQTDSSSPSILTTRKNSCPTCARYWELALETYLSSLSEQDCQNLTKLFQSTDYAIFPKILLRARAELALALTEERDPIRSVRLQGRAEQLRIIEFLPEEVQGLLAEFVEQDRRNEELAKEKEKRKNEVR
jgi:hypothetical protein